jgi:flagellar hook-associated protein 2
MRFESSHPDILSGSVDAGAVPGEFEVEVTSMARAARQLAFGFADPNQTPVGFGYMRVGVGDHAKDVVIEPGATLRDVASAINEAVDGVRATIINTGAKEDPFRLLVSSVESGEQIHLQVDPDTTFLETREQVSPQDLKFKFEGVDVTRSANAFADLVDGVSIKAMKAEPGTKVSLKIGHDVDQTADGIKGFVSSFNEIQAFAHKQNVVDSSGAKAQPLAGDSSVRQVSSSLQRSVGEANLASIGISTDPKTGTLKLDEAKLKSALSENYLGVADIFTSTERGPGLSQKLSDAIKTLQDKTSGAVGARIKGLDERIRRQDHDIERKQERVDQRKAQLQRTFAALDSKLATMNQQSAFLGARLSAPQPASPAPARDATTANQTTERSSP